MPPNFNSWPEDAQTMYQELLVRNRLVEDSLQKLKAQIEGDLSHLPNTHEANEFWLWRLFKEARDGYLLAFPDGTLIDGNTALKAMFGHPLKKTLAGKLITELGIFEPEQKKQLERALQKASRERLEKDLAFDCQTLDHTWMSVEIDLILIEIQRRNIILGIFRDVSITQKYKTELETALFAAESANRAKNTFLNNMSHELRTPLTAILGYTELLMEDVEAEGRADMLKDLKNIYLSAQHLFSLIGDLLDLARIETNNMYITLNYFDVQKTVESVVATLMSTINQGRNNLQVSCPDTLEMMYSDKLKFSQILFNLLSNAAKFTEHGEIKVEIEVETIEQKPWLRLSVVDTGIGIESEKLETIFDMFSQGDDSPTRIYGGAGLGLSITQRYVQLLKGQINVRSTVGKGSIFTVYLPFRLPEEMNWS
jgi:PAS domain S-box-containing protein